MGLVALQVSSLSGLGISRKPSLDTTLRIAYNQVNCENEPASRAGPERPQMSRMEALHAALQIFQIWLPNMHGLMYPFDVTKTSITLLIPGLDRMDRLTLAGDIQSDEIRFEDTPPSSERHGEIVTTAVVICTLATIKALTAYFLRDHRRGKLKRTIIVRNPDGSEREETIEVDIDRSHAPKADVIKQLGSITKTDISSLRKADDEK